MIQSMSLQPRLCSVVSPAPAREASQPGSEWWRNTFYRSSVSHHSPALSCLAGCSLPCFSSLQSSSPPKFARVLLALGIFFSDSGFLPLQKKTNEHDLTGTNTNVSCTHHWLRLLRPDAAAMQRMLELVRAPNQVPVVLRCMERHRKCRCRVPANLLGQSGSRVATEPLPGFLPRTANVQQEIP